MSEHTAGRWSISDEDRWSYEGFEIIASDGSCVAKTDGWGEEFSGEEEANARLISAAPELLEALEACRNELYAMIEKHNKRDEADGSWLYGHQTVAEADAVIAKARGN